MKAGVIAHWTGVVPGREHEALRLRWETDEFDGRLLAEGKLDDASWYLGSDGPHHSIMRGEEETLREIEMMTGALLITCKAGSIPPGIGHASFVTGDAAEVVLEMFERTAKGMQLA